MSKKILLCITGSIAAVKSYDLIQQLKEEKYEIQVIVSREGINFISPLAVEALTQNKVIGPKIFDENHQDPYFHLSISKNFDAILIAPATANTIAKISNGIADDFFTTTLLAANKKIPKIIAPAMNTKMLENPLTQKNISALGKENNYFFIPPQQSGILACGEEGAGKMATVETITKTVKKILTQPILKNKKVLINLGGTIEMIDPVRGITNLSSGKTGKIFAEKLWQYGADVTVIQGNSNIELNKDIFQVKKVKDTEKMLTAMENCFDQSDIIIFAAAVADFKIQNPAEEKIKKNDKSIKQPNLKLLPNTDIAKTLSKQKKSNQIFIGFTLETGNSESLKQSMIKKSEEKKFDIVLGNNPENFGTEIGKFLILNNKKEFSEIRGPKTDIFDKIINKEIFF